MEMKILSAAHGAAVGLACAVLVNIVTPSVALAQVADWGIQRWAIDVDNNKTADLCRVIVKGPGRALACTLSPTRRVEDLYAGATIETGVIDTGYEQGNNFVDFDGDGKLDYCRVVGNHGGPGYVTCTFFDGRAFGATVVSPALDWGYPETRKWVDVNNDRRADYCRVIGNNREYYMCTLSNGRKGFGREIKDIKQ